MKILIRIGQNEAIRAGKNDFGVQAVDIDVSTLSSDEREMLAMLQSEKEMKRLYGQHSFQSLGNFVLSIPNIDEATTEKALSLLAHVTAEYAKGELEAEEEKKRRAAQIEADIQKMISRGPEKALKYANSYWPGERYMVDWNISLPDDPRLERLYAEANRIANAKNTELEAADEKRRTEKKAEEEAKAKAEAEKEAMQTAQINEWVGKNGTDSQKKRLAVGLLPVDEITDLIRSEAYRALKDIPRYERITTRDVCLCGCEETCDVDFDVEDAETATEEEFALMEKIQTLLPDSKVTLRKHTGTGETCENTLERRSIKVALTVGAFDFTREYAA